jgi:hypothetical protein
MDLVSSSKTGVKRMNFKNKLKLIAHRGNMTGANALQENTPEYIDKALGFGFDCEVDFWMRDMRYYLGHDYPSCEVPYRWLDDRRDRLWLHCKNQNALEYLNSGISDWHYFWHDKDSFTLTSKGFVWCYPYFPSHRGIVAVPEMGMPCDEVKKLLIKHEILGVCSDFVHDYSVTLRSLGIEYS